MTPWWTCSLGHLHTTWCPLSGQTGPLDATTQADTAWQVALLLEELEEETHAETP